MLEIDDQCRGPSIKEKRSSSWVSNLDGLCHLLDKLFVLVPFLSVQKLRGEHHVEVFSHSCCHLTRDQIYRSLVVQIVHFQSHLQYCFLSVVFQFLCLVHCFCSRIVTDQLVRGRPMFIILIKSMCLKDNILGDCLNPNPNTNPTISNMSMRT